MVELSTTLNDPQDHDEGSVSTDLGTSPSKDTTEATPAKTPEKQPRESRLDTIKRAAQEVAPKEQPKADDVKDGDEAKSVEQNADKAEAEPAKGVEGQKDNEATRQTQERQRRQPIEAPEKFMPRAKELWNNTPHEVRADMQRIIAESETAANEARESAKQYAALEPYAQMAKQSGTTLDQAVGRYVQMEQALRNDPAAGFRSLIQNMQMTPVQAIGHILAAHGVRPEQLAQHIMQAPNDYTALAQPQQRAQAPQPNGEVMQLRQQMAQMQQQMQQNQLMSSVIEPFARENPRYHELEPTIAGFLNSDMVPKSLSPHDRLATAYDMAVRISPQVKQSQSKQATIEENEADSRAGKDFGGTKSVRGAPASGVDTTNHRKGKLSRGDALRQAMSDLGVAH